MSEAGALKSPSLRLPLLAGEQTQKHVTVNEALSALDALVQLSVKSRAVVEPPSGPEKGDRYIVGPTPSGAWTAQTGAVAVWEGGVWSFHLPREGWLAWVADEEALLVFEDGGWRSLSAELQNLALLGLGTAADAANPFAAKLNNALWTARAVAEGGDGDLRLTFNKESAADVLSLLFQSGFSGRAEIGLTADDNLSVKVSADGAAWKTALVVDRSEGSVGIGAAPAEALHVRRTGTAFARILVEGENAVNNQVRRVSSNSSQPNFVAMKARGTIGAETAVLQNDLIGSFVAQAYDGAVYRSPVFITASVIAATPSATNMEARLVFTLAAPSAVNPTEVMRLEHATGLSMFGANPVIDANRHHRLRPYSVATLPSAAPAGQLIYVSDGSSNRRLAVSDGTAWRWPDGAVVT